MQDTVDMVDDPEYEEEEPSFSDPEDFVDDVEEEGEWRQESRRLSGLLLANRAKPNTIKLLQWYAGGKARQIVAVTLECTYRSRLYISMRNPLWKQICECQTMLCRAY